MMNPTASWGARLTVFAAVIGLSAQAALGAGSTTTYTTGNVFIGFRDDDVTNTLAVNLGAATKFLPTSLGGTWDGAPFTVQLGVMPAGNPGAGTPVFSLAPDLASVFDLNWADNPDDGTGLKWAVAGMTSNISANNPIPGLERRSVFLTVARDAPGTVAGAPLNFSNDDFALNFNSFAQGASGNA